MTGIAGSGGSSRVLAERIAAVATARAWIATERENPAPLPLPPRGTDSMRLSPNMIAH
jgi:hypothetical protein